MKNVLNFLLLSLTVVLTGCGTFKKPYYSQNALGWKQEQPHDGKKIKHVLYLVGDTGELDDPVSGKNTVLEVVKKDLATETNETSLVFLGDNIYPHGLPLEDAPDREISEKIINAQLACSREHSGNTYFIPGNHDWNKHKPGGREAIIRQEEYIKSHYGPYEDSVHFYPSNACGDPKVVKIDKDLVYVFLDTQWWLQNWQKEKKINFGCDLKSRHDLLHIMQDIFTKYKNDEIVVLMHHPIKSDGKHGGYFSFKQHVFPLTEVNKKIWIPLPVIGSIYPLYRKLTGSNQDVTNLHNQELMQGLDKLAKSLDLNIIFATGHDHGLQYFNDGKTKHIISGAGGKVEHVKSGGDADYARAGRGYVKVNFHDDFETWAEFYTLDPETNKASLEFRTQLRAARAGTVESKANHFPPIKDDLKKTMAASAKFKAGSIKELFLGEQYRDIWTTPVEVDVINLDTKYGGLTPIKKGGGQASNSLRMEHENGHQYILRSIKKDYRKLVPSGFKNLKIINFLADQNSASHPYGALAIPHLSKAAGVYYTDPKLTYLKHQSGLGNYNTQFPEELYLLEERPDGNWSEYKQFGNSTDIIGYLDLLEKLHEKTNHFVDQKWVLKSRMFDLFIHDWDRHDDQWRWMKFKEDGKNIYRPIPRDRDQAFYKFKGVVPWYISVFILKQFKTIKEDSKDVKHLSFNAKHFDRYFLNELEWKDWESIILKMQNDITETSIDEAMSHFPPEVLNLNDDEELGSILKSRRNNLLKMGRRLYDFLSSEVEITGTDHDDRFYITKNSDGSVHLKMEIKNDQQILTKYNRTFYPSETDEIRIYGLRGNDMFDVTGSSNDDIRIRVIGGEGNDDIKNLTSSSDIYVYDDFNGIKINGKAKNQTSTDLEVNEYDRAAFQYNTNSQFVNFGYTVDDGIWIGANLTWTIEGWRKDPYKAQHHLSFSVAPGSRRAFMVEYDGHFTEAVGKFDFVPRVEFSYPFYENFFGIGSESFYDTSLPTRFNWVRMQNIDAEPMLDFHNGTHTELSFGPVYQYRKVLLTEGRVSEDPELGFTADELDSRHFLGAKFNYNINLVDDEYFPSNGIRFNTSISRVYEVSREDKVTELGGNLSFYLKLLNRPKLVLANQIGYGRSYGNLQFYQFQALGNNHGLRGFRNERFRGREIFYINTDLRLKLLKWDSNVIPMDIGILGGYDYGNVKEDGSTDGESFSSITAGIWFQLLGRVVLQPHYSFNNEQNQLSVKLGFNF